jgi:hypothetical protein
MGKTRLEREAEFKAKIAELDGNPPYERKVISI